MKKSLANMMAAGKRCLSLFLIMCMLVTLFPATALAAEAPSGYTTDSHGIMAFKYTGNYFRSFDIKGYFNGAWKKVTYKDLGFTTILKEIDAEAAAANRYDYLYSGGIRIHASGNPYVISRSVLTKGSSLTVDIDYNYLYDGAAIQIVYTVHNTGSEAVTFSMASGGDIMIGSDDYATITPFNGGFKMSSQYASDGYAQLNFWGGAAIEGVTEVDSYWYGHYGKYKDNYFTDLSPKTTLSNVDSGCAWSWQNRTIAAGGTQTYSVMLGVGAPGSEAVVVPPRYTVSYSTTVGTEPGNPIVEEGESITLPVLTEPGYEFGGWYSDAELTSHVGNGGDSYTPNDDITLYAKWTAIQSPVNVTVTKDGSSWSGQSLAIYQNGHYKCALAESGASGLYSASTGNGTYDIYKDGVDTGEDLVVATAATSGSGEAVFKTVAYTTLTAITQLDGSPSTTPGNVDYRADGAVQLTSTEAGGIYTAVVRDNTSSGYDVYVNAADSNQDISVAANTATVDYFTGEVTVTLDSADYEGRNVVFSRAEGENTYYYAAAYDAGGKYTAVLPAGPDNDYTYTAHVDGRALSDTVSYGDKVSAAPYYTAHVDVQKDGSDWTSDDVSVYLENGGVKQGLTYTDGTDYQLVLFSDGSIYNVIVSGSNSPQDTGYDLSSNVVQVVDYRSVNFYTTDDASAYTGRIIQDGKTVSKPSAPNVTGKSFDGWYTSAERSDAYDYSEAITAATNIYAKYIDPAVSINDTVMGGGTYTIPNLTIIGFSTAGNPVKTAILTVDSGSISVTSGDGYTVTGSGGTTVTVKFGDDGTSMEDAQAFLRENVIATPESTEEGDRTTYSPQTLSVAVCGDTAEGGGATSSITVFPVNLNLDGGTINSGNLSYYQAGVGASLPTELSKSGKVFAGWYESDDFSGDPVSSIATGDIGEKTYYAKWADSSPEKSIVFGTPVLSGGSFTYPDLTLSPSTETVYSARISIDNGTVAVAEDVGHKVVCDSENTTATINFGAGGLTLADVQTLLRTKTSFAVTPADEYPSVTIELDGNVTSLPDGAAINAGDGTNGLNGHYYMYVPVSTDWNSAYNAAKTYRYMGMKGYLVTITSAEESEILSDILDGITDPSWTGGTLLKQDSEENYDSNAWVITSASDYFWRWVCGPEAGSEFHYGWTGADNNPVDSSGSRIGTGLPGDPADAVYTNWRDGQPNRVVSGDIIENFVVTDGQWTDCSAGWSAVEGYFVEFGGYSEGDDPGEFSDGLIIRGSSSTPAPATSGNNTATSDMIFGTPVLSGGSFTYPNLELTAPSGLAGNLYSVSVSIENGTVAVTGGDGYTVGYDLTNTTATINLGAGGMSVSDVQSLLQSKASFTGTSSTEYPVVTMTLDGNTTTLTSDFIFSAGNGTVGLNGHYYMYVPVSTDWNSAYNLAKDYSYMGMKGYLATVTSAVEDAALDSLTLEDGWAGGSLLKQDNEDDYDSDPWVITDSIDYSWRWVCGPEAGSEFHYGWNGADNNPVDSSGLRIGTDLPGDPADAVYTNWNTGEPNHHDHGEAGGEENTLQIHAGEYRKWNDVPASWDYSNEDYGYFVEFGGYPDGQDPGNPSDSLTLTGSNTAKAYAPTASGDTIYANGAALIISGEYAYWDMDSDGVLDDNEDDSAIYSSVSSSTDIYAGTTSSFPVPLSGQITVLDGSTVGTITGGNVNGPVVVKLAGHVEATIDFDTITMVAVTGTLTGGAGDIKLTANGDLGAGRVLAIDKTGAAVIDMTKFTLNNGDNALVAVDKELQISGYGVNTRDSVTTTLAGTAPTYITATVEVRENGSLADADSVVLKPESGDSIILNRSETGIYSYTGLLDNTTNFTLYVDGVAVGDSYNAFAVTNTNQAPSYYTAQVTYKVDGSNTDARSLLLKADGKDDIVLIQRTDADTGALVVGVYEYRALEDDTTEYSIWANGEDSGQTLKFASGDCQKTINRYTAEVSLTKSGAWSGQAVSLRDESGNIVYTLSETETSGTYRVLTDSDRVGTYRIYVNGEDSGTDITPSAVEKVSLASPISYMTAVVNTKVDGSPARIGTVAVGGNTAIENSMGNYSIDLPAAGYAVNVAGRNVGTASEDSPSLTANYYTVSYEENGASGTVPTDNTIYLGGSTVTLLSAGELSKTGYVFAGWLTGGITYDPGQTFTLAETAALVAQWSDAGDAQASWTVDGETRYGSLAEAIEEAGNTDLPVAITIQNNVTVTENVTIPDNAAVDVPEGIILTVAEDVTLTNEGTISSNGTITGEGTLDNNGRLDNTPSVATEGLVDIDIDNTGGLIEGGTITSGASVTGGGITGPISNNGTVDGADVTGNVTNDGTLIDTDVTGNVTNNNGAVISGGTVTGDVTNSSGAVVAGGTTVNGNVDNEGTVDNITVNGNLDSPNGTVTNSSVAGTTTAPGGGNITSDEALLAALGGAAHIDAETGVVVLDGDIQLDESIAITGGDIVIDLNGHSIFGPNGDDNDSGAAEDGGAAITISGGSLDIEDNSIGGGGGIYGGTGGAGSTVSGTGGAGISVTGGTLTVGEDVEVTGGTGGRDATGSSGSGGPGIAVGEYGNVTIEGDVTGGEGGVGGEGTSGGSGGSGIETGGRVAVAIEGCVIGGTGGAGDTGGIGGPGIANEGSGTVEVNGSVTGGTGGVGDTGGTGGAGVTNEGTGTIELSGTVAGGTGGMDIEGDPAESGTSISGTISYQILESGLTDMRLAGGSATVLDTEGGLASGDTDIMLECSYPSLYDMPAGVTVGVYNSSTGVTTSLDSSCYTYDSDTGATTILENAPVSGSVVINAGGVKKTGTVTITTKEELIEALNKGFSDIVLNGDISIDQEVLVPEGATLSIAGGKTITVENGGSFTNKGTITGEGHVSVENGGSVTNRSGASIETTQAISNRGTITNDGTIASSISNSGTVCQVDGATEITVTGTAAVTVLKVSYNVKGVGTAPDSALNVNALPDPLPGPGGATYYTFNGWYTDSSCTTEAIAGTAITGNTVLHASWTYTGERGSNTSEAVSEGSVPVIVDGVSYTIGTAETSDGVTTVTPDMNEMRDQIAGAEAGSEVIVPVATAESANSGAAALVLQNIEDMNTKNMGLTVEVDGIRLTLPPGSIDPSSVAQAVSADNYGEVPIAVSLNTLSGNPLRTVLQNVERTGAQTVGNAFEFTVTAQYGGQSVELMTFRHFTSRRLPIEEGGEITTAVVVEADGTLRHVPTNGRTELAIVSSLTNSTYVLIYNEQSFADAKDKWYEDTVNEMASRKIINGVGNDLFAGERSITRAEFAAIIVRALGLPADGTANFADVSGSAWYAGAVGTAYEYGIVNGKSADSFDPIAKITRQEAMAMVARASEIAEFEGETTADLSAFTDTGNIDAWAQRYVEYNVANGLIVGKGGGKLDPLSDISRAETATVVLRLLRKSELVDVRN